MANMLDSVGGEDSKGSKGEVRLTTRLQEETGSPHPLTQEGSTGVRSREVKGRSKRAAMPFFPLTSEVRTSESEGWGQIGNLKRIKF